MRSLLKRFGKKKEHSLHVFRAPTLNDLGRALPRNETFASEEATESIEPAPPLTSTRLTMLPVNILKESITFRAQSPAPYGPRIPPLARARTSQAAPAVTAAGPHAPCPLSQPHVTLSPTNRVSPGPGSNANGNAANGGCPSHHGSAHARSSLLLLRRQSANNNTNAGAGAGAANSSNIYGSRRSRNGCDSVGTTAYAAPPPATPPQTAVLRPLKRAAANTGVWGPAAPSSSSHVHRLGAARVSAPEYRGGTPVGGAHGERGPATRPVGLRRLTSALIRLFSQRTVRHSVAGSAPPTGPGPLQTRSVKICPSGAGAAPSDNLNTGCPASLKQNEPCTLRPTSSLKSDREGGQLAERQGQQYPSPRNAQRVDVGAMFALTNDVVDAARGYRVSVGTGGLLTFDPTGAEAAGGGAAHGWRRDLH